MSDAECRCEECREREERIRIMLRLLRDRERLAATRGAGGMEERR